MLCRIAVYSGRGAVSDMLRLLVSSANLIVDRTTFISGVQGSSSSAWLSSLFRVCDRSSRMKERSPHLPAALLIKSARQFSHCVQ